MPVCHLQNYVERSSRWNRVGLATAAPRVCSRRNSRRLWREGLPLVGCVAAARQRGGGARARPPVFPRTMPNGAFVKVSSFTADGGRRAPPDIRRCSPAPTEGRRKAARLFHRAESAFISIRCVLQVNYHYYCSVLWFLCSYWSTNIDSII